VNFYKPPPAEEPLLQGDILFPVPFILVETNSEIEEEPQEEPEKATGGRKFVLTDLTKSGVKVAGNLIASYELCTGIVLSQSCDLASGKDKENIIIGRVYSCAKRIENWKDDFDSVKKKIDTFRQPGKSPQYFYLPELINTQFTLPKSVAYLLEIQTFPPSEFDTLALLRKASLSNDALAALQERLSVCLGRFGAPDDLYYNQAEWDLYQSAQAKKAATPKKDKQVPKEEGKLEPAKPDTTKNAEDQAKVESPKKNVIVDFFSFLKKK
jgi:hypothetical protein